MRNIFLLLFLLVVTFIHAQEKPIDVTKIKTCKTFDCFINDSVFIKAADAVKITFEKYELVDISDIVSLRDSLLTSKLSYNSFSYDISYKTLDEFVVNSNKSKTLYISNTYTKKNFYKKLFCFRTLSPDENGKYKVHFYILE